MRTASRQRQSLERLAHGASRGVGERGDSEIASTSQCAALTRCLGKNSCLGDSPRRCRKRSGKRTPGLLLAAVATVCPRKAVGLKNIACRTGGKATPPKHCIDHIMIELLTYKCLWHLVPQALSAFDASREL